MTYDDNNVRYYYIVMKKHNSDNKFYIKNQPLYIYLASMFGDIRFAPNTVPHVIATYGEYLPTQVDSFAMPFSDSFADSCSF